MKAPLPPDSGINVIGYVSGNLGLGVSARHMTQLLVDRGHPTAVLDFDPGFGRGRHDNRFEPLAVASPDALPHGINLVMLPVQNMPNFVLRPPKVFSGGANLKPGYKYWFRNGTINAAVVWWELPVLAPIWADALQLFDVVIAPSDYIRSTLDAQLSNVVTIPALHPLYLPEGIVPSRERFGLPEESLLYVMCFEPFSDIARKNPFAGIEAFRRAFPDRTDAKLVIRLNNAARLKADGANPLDDLRRSIAGDPRVIVIDGPLGYVDVLSLYASCDVFVSMHRAEGFGLGLIEAMALGKPVIATGWSGNMTYMNQQNSCLVRHRLVPVQAAMPYYQPRFLQADAVWAEPSVDDAAVLMRKLHENADHRAAIGHRAAADAAAFHRRALEATFMDELMTVRDMLGYLPKNAQQAPQRVDGLAQAVLRHRSQTETIWDRGRRVLDRHLLWRFNDSVQT